MKIRGWALVVAILSRSVFADAPEGAIHQQLLLFGGGALPAAGIARFCELAGGKKAHLLVIRWASQPTAENPETSPAQEMIGQDGMTTPQPQSLDSAFKDCVGFEEQAVHVSRLQNKEDKAAFLLQVARATAVFFTGGVQKRIMAVFRDHPELATAVLGRYQKGMLLGGSSAGTAIMSPIMLTGGGNEGTLHPEAMETAPGLGALPGLIVDQHFIKRQRFFRLLSVLMGSELSLGLGIDEGAGVEVVDNRFATVLGGTATVAHYAESALDFSVQILPTAHTYDLMTRRRLANAPGRE